MDKLVRINGYLSNPNATNLVENDNLRGEYDRLFEDVPTSIPFARIALGKEDGAGTELDAVNFWLGKIQASLCQLNLAHTHDRELKIRHSYAQRPI